MNSKRYVKYSLVLLVALLLGTACTDDEFGYGEGDGEVMVSFRPRLDAGIQTRAIGDGTSVNRLDVLVFEGDELVKREGYSIGTPVNLTLFEGRSYKILFWAQYGKEGSKPYSIADDGTVTVDYENFSENGYESLDAFYAVDEFTVNALMGTQNRTISLNRPLAQLNFADVEQPQQGAVTVSLTGLVTSFNPFAPTSSVVSEEEASQSFTFTSFPEDELVTRDGEFYRYVASMYLFPATVDATISFNEQTKQISDIPLETNKRTNVIGTIVQEPEDIWNGEEPTEAPVIEEDCYIIDSNEDLAWLAYNEATVSSISIEKDLNMGNQELGALQLLPNTIVWGNGHTIKNLCLNGALFGDATSLTVENVSIVDATVSSDNSHVGVLVNTLIGGGSFSGITVTNASVITTNGAAGGLVGYVVRETEQSRDKTLDVSFSDCTLSRVHVSGTSSEGKFVGRLSGYDHGETLHFGSDCSVDDVNVEDYVSPYTEGNEAAWFADNDYSDYDGWLGDEEYCRGTVKFDVSSENPEGIRFIPKWDGVRTVEPLLADPEYDGENVSKGNNRFVVYSPFDLAGVREKSASPAAIYLRADIDMNGQGDDGEFNVPSNFTQSENSSTDDNLFNPFSYVTTLDGYKDEDENYSIYNLSISQIEQERAAFILYASGTTVHKNINFRNCQTVSVHKPVTTDAKAYGAILVSNVDATYTMENVHAYDCKVFALQKVGTLGARISGTSTLKNNSVNNCYVENYECKISERFTSGEKTIGDWTVEVYADFYPYGEVGGMYGYIQGNSTLTDCKVNGTTIYAYGQDDKKATVDGNFLAKLGVAALGYYKVPGRHVSTMIGNIRATGTVTLTGCVVDSDSECIKRHDKHNDNYKYIGQAYIVKFVDSEGSVTVDGKKLTLADCNIYTKR